MPFHVLLCFNCLDSHSSLVAFLIHHVRLAAVPLHCACLPTVSQISLSDAWHTLLPHCSLTGELILPSPLLNSLVLMGTTAFSHGSSIQGSRYRQGRRAHSQMSLDMCYASGIRLLPDICGLSPPLLPANDHTQDHGHFNLEMFSPGCVHFTLTVDSPLLSSLISLGHAGPQRMASQMNKLHFTSVHLKNCPQRFPPAPQHQEKNG